MQPLADDKILDMLLVRQREIEQLQKATFEEKGRHIEGVDLQVTISEGVAYFSCKLPLSRPKPVALLIAPTAF